jgi:hypothetical protein
MAIATNSKNIEGFSFYFIAFAFPYLVAGSKPMIRLSDRLSR